MQRKPGQILGRSSRHPESPSPVVLPGFTAIFLFGFYSDARGHLSRYHLGQDAVQVKKNQGQGSSNHLAILAKNTESERNLSEALEMPRVAR